MLNLGQDLIALRDARHIKNHVLFDKWATGELTLNQIGQYLAQHYHLPNDLIGAMGIGFAKAPMDVRTFIIHNMAEEFGLVNEDGHEPAEHNRMLLDFIVLCGIDEEQVVSGKPLPLLQALFDKIWRIAYNEPWEVYLAMCSSFESQMVGMQKRVLPAMRSHYGFPKGDKRVAWFEEHETADERHGSQLLTLVEKYVVDPSMAERCKAVVVDVCDARLRYVDSFYETFVSPLPEVVKR